MQVQLIRHATLRITMCAHTLLVDPMLSPKDAMDPIQNAANDIRIPMVELPFSPDEILKGVEAILVTHTHRDHWDDAATDAISKALPIMCQPEDKAKFESLGFTDVRPVNSMVGFEDIQISRTAGQHGTGEVGRKMAPVSGYVLRTEGEPALYIAGDTIYCPEVEQAIARYRPNVVVVNAGAAEFKTGGPITMTKTDVARTAQAVPRGRIVAVHMETINHCLLHRNELEREMKHLRMDDRVAIPEDGATLEYR